MYKPDYRHLVTDNNTPDNIWKMVSFAINKRKKRKEPKCKAEDGAYCPKVKPGQAWSHTKDNGEKRR